jgi:hypothetical protein
VSAERWIRGDDRPTIAVRNPYEAWTCLACGQYIARDETHEHPVAVWAACAG